MDREKRIQNLMTLAGDLRAIIVTKVTERENAYNEERRLEEITREVRALMENEPKTEAADGDYLAQPAILKEPKAYDGKDTRDEVPF